MQSLGQSHEEGLAAEIGALKAKNALLVDALDHIKKAADASRTNTRRLRWIGERAVIAMRGEVYTNEAFDLPKYAAGKDDQLIRQKTEKARALRQALNMLRGAIGAIIEGDELDAMWQENEPEVFAEYQRLRAIAWPDGQGDPPEER
jgi:hypothetical protein